MGFSIESAPAKHKYSEVAAQIKFGHLNLKFDQDAFPKFSNGFLAQLAGARSLRSFRGTLQRGPESNRQSIRLRALARPQRAQAGRGWPYPDLCPLGRLVPLHSGCLGV